MPSLLEQIQQRVGHPRIFRRQENKVDDRVQSSEFLRDEDSVNLLDDGGIVDSFFQPEKPHKSARAD